MGFIAFRDMVSILRERYLETRYIFAKYASLTSNMSGGNEATLCVQGAAGEVRKMRRRIHQFVEFESRRKEGNNRETKRVKMGG